MNKHTASIITSSDNSIDTNKNINALKSEPQSTRTDIRGFSADDKTLNIWNWRIETDTAELFIGMFG